MEDRAPVPYADQYLSQYWPEQPVNADMWADNLELLSAYFKASEVILFAEGGPVKALDISTGPCLAPLMASMRCIDSVLLSDFVESNRERMVNSPIEYWKRYAEELTSMFPDNGLVPGDLLSKLDKLRRQSAPLFVDLRNTPIFSEDQIALASMDLVTMHFVADSICDTVEECFSMLRRVLQYIRPNGWLLLSALIDSEWWMLGDHKEPSPKLKDDQLENELIGAGFTVVTKVLSLRKPDQIYEGGWVVLLARRTDC